MSIYLNGAKVTPTIFPDKTSQVWKLETDFPFVSEVKWEFESEAEFMHLAQLKDLLDTEGVKYTKLVVSYLPYARQDKSIANNATFALTTFSKLLNLLHFTEVIIDDVHSPKALQLIKHSKSIVPDFMQIADSLGANICYPDFGASRRYGRKENAVTLNKTRNQSTGELTIAPLTEQLSGPYLIVDDLVDGGGTFIAAAKILSDAGASEVNLYTTHGIYSKGVQVLRDAGIKRIFNIKGEI